MTLDPHWQTLRRHAARLRDVPLRDLVRAEGRAAGHALRVGPLYANFARQHVDDDALAALLGLAQAAGVPGALEALFDGAQVNASERRPALHSALRGDAGASAVALSAQAQARAARERVGGMVA